MDLSKKEPKWNIRAISAGLDMTIRELAEASGIKYSHLSKVYQGILKMNEDDLEKLSTFTGLPKDKIVSLNRKNNKESEENK
ncbi:MAG: helix-turn-helix transcriptional regulator [Lachnospiraceae bacterium]|nr:helix-turn-helix transcriptional regulator [Lachnospiraceae bacterium]